MTKQFVTKDSGKRIDYASGMRRDTQEGKPDYTLIYQPILYRWAALMTRGADKYGRHNWTKANSEEEMERFYASLFRHFMQYLNGDEDEDHLAACCFNFGCIEYLKSKGVKYKFPYTVTDDKAAN